MNVMSARPGSISPVPRSANPTCLRFSSASGAAMPSRRFAARAELARCPVSASVTEAPPKQGGGGPLFSTSNCSLVWLDNQCTVVAVEGLGRGLDCSPCTSDSWKLPCVSSLRIVLAAEVGYPRGVGRRGGWPSHALGHSEIFLSLHEAVPVPFPQDSQGEPSPSSFSVV